MDEVTKRLPTPEQLEELKESLSNVQDLANAWFLSWNGPDKEYSGTTTQMNAFRIAKHSALVGFEQGYKAAKELMKK